VADDQRPTNLPLPNATFRSPMPALTPSASMLSTPTPTLL
jgi:hypothetical protein